MIPILYLYLVGAGFAAGVVFHWLIDWAWCRDARKLRERMEYEALKSKCD